MLDRAECMLARAGRQSGLLVGALFIDIDWFKDVNEQARRRRRRSDPEDRRGTARGRRARRRHGRAPRAATSSCCWSSRPPAARAWTHWRDAWSRRCTSPFELDGFGPSFFLTASIGVAFGRYATPEDLLRDAQLALHAAKAAGKDRYTLFNANMRSVIEGRGVLEVELNAALAETAVLPALRADLRPEHRQGGGPRGARCAGCTPSGACCSPDDFIPLAEETGLTVPIGRWVLEEACGRAAAWNVAGHQHRHLGRGLAQPAQPRRLRHGRSARAAAVGRSSLRC